MKLGRFSSVVESEDSWKWLSLEKLQTCTASGRDVAHLVCQTNLLHGSHRVTSSYDRGHSLSAQLRKLLCYGLIINKTRDQVTSRVSKQVEVQWTFIKGD